MVCCTEKRYTNAWEPFQVRKCLGIPPRGSKLELLVLSTWVKFPSLVVLLCWCYYLHHIQTKSPEVYFFPAEKFGCSHRCVEKWHHLCVCTQPDASGASDLAKGSVVRSCIFNNHIVFHRSCLWLLLWVALILKCNIALNANDSILTFIIKAIFWA